MIRLLHLVFRCCARPVLRVYLRRTGSDHPRQMFEDYSDPGAGADEILVG